LVGGQLPSLLFDQQTPEFLGERLTGFVLEPEDRVAQPPAVHTEPNGSIEVEVRIPALEATIGQVNVGADRATTARAGRAGVGGEFRPARVTEGGGRVGLAEPAATRPDQIGDT
jgi:hypothetical protein